MLIGYARVSNLNQNFDLQISELQKAGCEKIYEDRASSGRENLPGLEGALGALRTGDTLAVWKLDRIGRNLKQLLSLAEELEKNGIHFRSLADDIDTSTQSGRFFFRTMKSLADMERDLTVERTTAGLLAARSRGLTGGRKRLMTESKLEAAKKLLQSGRRAAEVAASLGVSVPTLYRWLPAGPQGSAVPPRTDEKQASEPHTAIF